MAAAVMVAPLTSCCAVAISQAGGWLLALDCAGDAEQTAPSRPSESARQGHTRGPEFIVFMGFAPSSMKVPAKATYRLRTCLWLVFAYYRSSTRVKLRLQPNSGKTITKQ